MVLCVLFSFLLKLDLLPGNMIYSEARENKIECFTLFPNNYYSINMYPLDTLVRQMNPVHILIMHVLMIFPYISTTSVSFSNYVPRVSYSCPL
jgi:hypothetical protein